MEPLWLSRRSAIVLSIALALLAAALGGFALGREVGFRDAKGRPTSVTTGTPGPPSPAGVSQGSGGVIPRSRPDCPKRTGPITVSQQESDGPMAVQWFDHEQAAAQTFLVPVSGLALGEVAVRFEYAMGRGATLRVYEVTDPHDPTSGPELASQKLDALSILSGTPTRVRLTPALFLRCGQLYSITIEPSDRSTSLGVSATAFPRTGNVYPGGSMFLGRKGHWQDTGGDMTFQVTFVPATF